LSFSIETSSQDETKALGERLGRILGEGDIVCFYGDLGTGKTTFIKGVAKALHISDREITSASFIIISEHFGRHPLYHIDLYRIAGPHDIMNLGVEEYLYGDGIAVVEWADRLTDVDCTFSVTMRYREDDGRAVTISGSPEQMKKLRKELC
jgi:tRNA threonylcarbamoyladenosine biosynthesis protein TsaE